jgi:hypothetical protein
VLLSAWLYFQGLDRYQGEHLYSQIATWVFEQLSLGKGPAGLDMPRVMVNDPASFHYYSRLPALSIPHGDVDTVLDVMDRFGVEYLILDGNYVPLRALYEAPGSQERLALLAAFEADHEVVYLYKLHGETEP